MIDIMQNESYKRYGVSYVRVSKVTARKVYNSGKRVFLIQDRMRFDNAWQSPFPIFNASGRDFDMWVNEFVYYNCNNEQGRTVKYFVAESDLPNRA